MTLSNVSNFFGWGYLGETSKIKPL